MGTDTQAADRGFLDQAARAALKGRGFVEPNPMVGAVVVSPGGEVFKGWHADYGGPHAEKAALAKAHDAARGGTLYVTLEPCSTTGKTPPCVEAIIDARVARVVVGAHDPNGVHNGRGIGLLKDAGLTVDLLHDPGCEALLDRFKICLGRSRPWMVVKWAMTLDGRIAARDRSSQWISGEKSRRLVHRLRGHSDAVMVGAGTVRADDPSLNCRLKKAPLRAARIVVDPDLSTPPGARLFQLGPDGTFPAGPAAGVTVPGHDRRSLGALEEAGADILTVDCDSADHRLFLEKTLDRLFEKGIKRLLIEGGSGLITSAVDARLADEAVVFVAPVVVGGADSLSPVLGKGAPSMEHALRLSDVSVTRSGQDALLIGFFQ